MNAITDHISKLLLRAGCRIEWDGAETIHIRNILRVGGPDLRVQIATPRILLHSTWFITHTYDIADPDLDNRLMADVRKLLDMTMSMLASVSKALYSPALRDWIE